MAHSSDSVGGISPDFQTTPSWRIFRIMSEFVSGFTFLGNIERSVTVFGSARLPQSHPYCKMAYELGRRLAQGGYTVVTGGGPGVMEAANHGAWDAGGNSVGLNIELPHEQRVNPYVRRSTSFHYFFSRKVMLDFSAEAYIFFPGGFGTLDEFAELITLVQTGKQDKTLPIILFGRTFWEPLTSWMQTVLLESLHTVAPQDLTIWTVTDDLDEVMEIVNSAVRVQEKQRLESTGREQPTPDEKLRKATRPMAGTEQ
ncbi:MAG TPA: TIGR00730 family Rossman fold protein [Ktedonobacterales bacterium]